MFRYNFDENANDAINHAFSEARAMGHRFVGTEHLLLGLAMLNRNTISETFEYYKITSDQLKAEILKQVGRGPDEGGIEDYTPRAKMALERSRNFADQTESQEIMAEHLFISILEDKQASGYKILSSLSLNILTLLETVFEKSVKDPEKHIIKHGDLKQYEVKQFDLEMDYDLPQIDSGLEKLTINLSELVSDDPSYNVYGREGEINRMIQILTRKTKNNPCLVGAPGIGKTAIVYGLAKAIVDKNVPDNLLDKEILSVNSGALVAGAMYRGQFEERVQQLVELVRKNKRYILFFDEIHTLIGLGATGEKSMDAIGLLKPYLTSGEIQMISATTDDAFEKHIVLDGALSRRLIKVAVEEPSEKVCLEILRNVKHHYETYHDVIISSDALEASVKLSKRYLLQRKLPDKAIDILDEACSRKRIENLKTSKILDELKYRLNQLKVEKEHAILNKDFETASNYQREEKRIIDHIEKNEKAKHLMTHKKLTIDVGDIENVVSDWASIPVQKLSTREKDKLRNLTSLLEDKIIGQTQAVEVVSRALKRSRVGIKDEHRPVGCFLFVGPTGVGKTELSKVITEVFYGNDKHMIRFDMSEYMERHSVSKLIGAPPGYEGHQDGGLLTNALQRQPYSVIVFDEIEKAHLEVLNVLLQMMDEGHLTDGRGLKVDVKNALIIMTSNLGVDRLNHRRLGFGKDQADTSILEEKLREAAKDYFKPEFINRLDEIVVFNPLEEEAMAIIVDLQLKDFTHKFHSETGCLIGYDPEVLTFIAKACQSTTYGARPIKRYIDRHIKDAIADVLLAEDQMPERINIHIENDTLEFERNA